MILKELAEILNIDLATTVSRFGNNEMLFVRFIKKFPNDKTYSALCEAVENKDYKAIETSAHTLKGIAANLGLSEIQSFSDNIVIAVRNEKYNDIDELFVTLKSVYQKAIDAISCLE